MTEQATFIYRNNKDRDTTTLTKMKQLLNESWGLFGRRWAYCLQERGEVGGSVHPTVCTMQEPRRVSVCETALYCSLNVFAHLRQNPPDTSLRETLQVVLHETEHLSSHLIPR